MHRVVNRIVAMQDSRSKRAIVWTVNMAVVFQTMAQLLILVMMIYLSEEAEKLMGWFSKVFVKREMQEIVEMPKLTTVDADTLLARLEIIRQDYHRKSFDKKNRAFARGALSTIDEITSIVKEMPKHEV